MRFSSAAELSSAAEEKNVAVEAQMSKNDSDGFGFTLPVCIRGCEKQAKLLLMLEEHGEEETERCLESSEMESRGFKHAGESSSQVRCRVSRRKNSL